MVTHVKGRYVLFEDYAALDKLCKKLMKHHSDISCENIMLRKAGDELALSFATFHLLHRGKIDTTTQPDIVAWNAAKEGKQP